MFIKAGNGSTETRPLRGGGAHGGGGGQTLAGLWREVELRPSPSRGPAEPSPVPLARAGGTEGRCRAALPRMLLAGAGTVGRPGNTDA